MSDSVGPHRLQPTRLLHPWDSPGKNTGVGCHFLLQCLKVKSESEVVQSCLTFSDPMDCSLPGSSVHGIFQARVLEWVAIAFPTIVWPQVNSREGTQLHPSIENWITDLLSMALPFRIRPSIPLRQSLSHQEAFISLLSFSIRGQTD
ncbi:unnamed protein product [Rangifer tarandus platyrhynchus]|uniref:Uncharacterized protein n=2 Tax=Rangifer tarandus platyrhynchus TaxID=3082113 RepID=A0ABN8YH82_RANTA|nr:unnamed protein product [Rangifer tarandus platyrhynchus]